MPTATTMPSAALVDDQPDADHDDGERGGGETRQSLDEPADLLDVARGDRDDLTGGDPPGQRGAQGGRPAGEELLDPGRRGDPVGDRRPVQHRVAEGQRGAEEQDESAREGES